MSQLTCCGNWMKFGVGGVWRAIDERDSSWAAEGELDGGMERAANRWISVPLTRFDWCIVPQVLTANNGRKLLGRGSE